MASNSCCSTNTFTVPSITLNAQANDRIVFTATLTEGLADNISTVNTLVNTATTLQADIAAAQVQLNAALAQLSNTFINSTIINSDTTIAADDFVFGVHATTADVSDGDVTVTYPVGLPEDSVIRIAVHLASPTADAHKLIIKIGDGTQEVVMSNTRYVSDSGFGYIIEEGFVQFQKKGVTWQQIMGVTMDMSNLFEALPTQTDQLWSDGAIWDSNRTWINP